MKTENEEKSSFIEKENGFYKEDGGDNVQKSQ